MNYKHLNDGDSLFIAKGFYVNLSCCDCGLVHKVEVQSKILDKQKGVQLTFFRDKRRTSQKRRYLCGGKK